ncbi:GNAT family N-acetyltransferase [Modestobacter sp. VKM Ac-2978]|uniref:GNAT family N-acetyltransferase n=1 Tax=Modestobacter sp. VKM Ac-2978 TaxID=3004132 RepID=UPI0022AAC371|nr:GNAT family N-acetyltransferase [Modestobacter sp. VKM Ac-2978]MCZ2848948.1 GNAT family N-acetyltransferase [Modestobacter sp. VKM Ac-2978]
MELPKGRGLTGRADVSVRPAAAADAEAIARVQVVTWRTAYRSLLPAQVLDEWDDDAATTTWRTAVAAPPTSEHGVLVAVESGTVVGFAAYGPTDDPDVADLATLLVEPRWGRRGHGSRLLAAVADLATERRVRSLHTWVPEDDLATGRFLGSAGWATDGWTRTLDTGAAPLSQLRWTTRLDDDEHDEERAAP